MPRKRRIIIKGEVHHVMSRGIDGIDIFTNKVERSMFLQKLADILQKSNCLCYAWCLMPNHYHLVLRPLDISLSTIMRRLNGSYARRFNKLHNRRGYLFQDRYKSVAAQDSMYFRELIRYVHMNPLRAGLVKSLDKLKDYPWSGHRALLGLENCPWMAVKETLSRFSPSMNRARDVYCAFLAEGIERGGTFETIWDEIRAVAKEPGGDARFGDGRIVGEPEFVRKAMAQKEAQEHRLRKMRSKRPELSSLLKQCLRNHRIKDPGDLLRGRKGERRKAREEFCRRAYKDYGYSLSEIGAYLGMQPAAVFLRANS
jgi:REP element-mobilizing transposase RayT